MAIAASIYQSANESTGSTSNLKVYLESKDFKVNNSAELYPWLMRRRTT